MEIADWLRGLSLERYAETFRENAVDVAVLPEVTEGAPIHTLPEAVAQPRAATIG